jgi:hypothetical protein
MRQTSLCGGFGLAENYYCMYWRAEDAFNPMPWIVGERKNPQ